MPIFSIICYIMRNLRNVSEKYKNNLIYADSKEFEVIFWLFSAQFCRKCIRIKHLFLLYGLFPRFLAHFYATFLYFLQTNIQGRNVRGGVGGCDTPPSFSEVVGKTRS